MRRMVLVALVMITSMTLGACTSSVLSTSPKDAVNDNRGLVCAAAKTWIAAGAVKDVLTDRLTSAIDKAEKSASHNGGSEAFTNLMHTARRLVSGNKRESSLAAKEIRKRC